MTVKVGMGLGQETADLTRELEVLQVEATRSKRECQLKTEAEQQYARRSSQQVG